MKLSQAEADLIASLRLKHYSLATERTYVHWLRRFFGWLRSNAWAVTPQQRMEGFLTSLAQSDVAAATQNQAFSSILFFYREVLSVDPGPVDALRAKRPQFLRHAPSREAVAKLLGAVRDTPSNPFRLIVSMLYGCGLRISEPLSIRIRDLDLSQHRIIIRQAKGAKDRTVNIPETLFPAIQNQIEASRVVWKRSRQHDIPVQMPNRLDLKYPSAAKEFGWFWLFPMANSCLDPRDGRRVWWHCLPKVVQDAVRSASIRAGLDCRIRPHDLRHAWATHAHDAGASVRDIQEILGHKDLTTTMIYVHPDPERVRSPLDLLPRISA